MPSISGEKDKAEGTPFALRNASSGFEGRSTNIFGQLDILERQHVSHEQNRTDLEEFADLRRDKDDPFLERNRTDQRRNAAVTQDGGDCFNTPEDAAEDTGPGVSSDKPSDSTRLLKRERELEKRTGGRQPPRQENPFRRPSGRPPGRYRGQRSRVPDHGNKPQTWTHYSLEDVKGSDMSDKANTQAALAFLDERRKLKEKEEMDVEEEEAFDVGSAACSKGMFSFAKRSKTDKSDDMCDDDKPEKSQAPLTDNVDKLDKDKSAVSAVKLAVSDIETEVERTLEEETPASSSTMKEDTIQTSFKSRKGIRRNIRARDDD